MLEKPLLISIINVIKKFKNNLAELSLSKSTPQKYPIEHPTKYITMLHKRNKTKFLTVISIARPK